MLEALILGIVEGVTEFLPISSTGHLLILQHWLTRRSDLFNIAIQAGAIVAVSLVYRERIAELLRGWREAAQRDYLVKVLGAFGVTAAPRPRREARRRRIAGNGAAGRGGAHHRRRRDLHRRILRAPPRAGGARHVGRGRRRRRGASRRRRLSGTSRSAAAIFAAMFAGLTLRPRATEFAFLVGIPTMFAAAGFELVKTLADGAAAGTEAWHELAVAFVAAAVTGFAAVKWLLGFISGHTFVAFAWYRIALGLALLLFL
jgi:undecaprenyl-diphosphatase